MTSDDYLLISGIQHYKFCPRQWALIHLEQQWVENYFTASGRLMHEKADSGFKEKRGDIVTVNTMPVISHGLKIQGNCDVVEFIAHAQGVNIPSLGGTYDVYPIEYKRGKPKTGTEDHLQLTAQAMCLEEMLCTTIEYGYMFYKATKRREKVEFTKALRDEVMACTQVMHDLFSRKYTPKSKKKAVCKSCSLYTVCLPQLFKTPDPKKFIVESLRE